MPTSIQPGTVLGGRYLLADLLDDVEGARVWRAVDQVLERNVGAYVVAGDDPRADRLLEAARTSATVTDPHLLRVLDADVDHRGGTGLTWVVSEWGAGQSLDVMVGQQPLPADRAAWLVREVAAAIAVAHAHGQAHGRLAPENVMVTESGTVRLIGFALDAAVQRGRLRSGNYPDCSPQEADLLDLAGLLYASLVGRWPGASGSQVKPAPRDGRGPLRPRQVRAGVPKPLDAICDRMLSRSHPNRTAHQLSAVLTEYIGELAVTDPALTAVALPDLDSSLDDLAAATGTLGSRGTDEPVVPASPGDTTTPLVIDAPAAPEPDAGPATAATATPADGPDGDLHDESVEREWSEDDTVGTDETDQTDDDTVAAPPRSPDPTPAAASAPDPEATQRSAAVDHEEAAGLDPDWHRPGEAEAPPLPPFEPVPERPLFAPEGTRRTPRGATPRSETAGWGTEVAAARIAAGEHGDVEDTSATGLRGLGLTDTGTDLGPDTSAWDVPPAQRRPHWPLGEDDPDGVADDWEERTRRPWLRAPLVVAVLAVLAVLVAGALALSGRTDLPLPGKSDSSPSATPSARSGQVIKVRAVKDLDPFAVPPEENPDEVRNAIDGDPGTAWTTVTYRRRPDLGGLKPGVGLVLDLGSIQRVGSVDLRLVGDPTGLTVFTAPTASGAPTGIEGLRTAAQREAAGTSARIRFDQPVRTRYVVVWLTSLPKAGGGFQGGVAEVVVRS